MKQCNISVKSGFGFWAMLAVSVYYGSTMTAFFAAAAVHELGHILALMLLEKDDLNIELKGLGIYIERKNKLVSRANEAIVLICGPLAGALSGFLLRKSCIDFFRVSMMLSAVNSIPVKGTDGGSLMELYFYNTLDNAKRNVIAAVSTAAVMLIYMYFAKEQTVTVAAAAFIFWLRGMLNGKKSF